LKNTMARIVVVKPLFPYPPNQGTRRVSLALLADLATAHEVVYLCQRDSRAEAELIPQVEKLGVRVVAPLMPNHISSAHKLAYKFKNRIASRITGVPELSLYWSNRALRANLERLCREVRPELTILENWETYPLRRSITGGRAALLAHDAAFRILERAVAAAPDDAERARREARLRALKRLEVEAWKLFDGILTLTEADRETIIAELAQAGVLRERQPVVEHLQVPVPAEFFGFARPEQAGLRVGFIGTFRADFNRDALGFVLDEIWPRILARTPGAKLRIAGDSYAGPLKARAQSMGARWLGFVDDLGSYFASIDVLLVPLRFGGGVRIRILEALAAGVPVVATPVAVAGLACEPGTHVRVAPDAEGLAGEVARLLAAPAEARALGERGRAWCAGHHGPEVLRGPRLAAVARMLGDAPRQEP
jgi:glycosyltransferase involved in cell wall biosynthesis